MSEKYSSRNACWTRANSGYVCADGTSVVCRLETFEALVQADEVRRDVVQIPRSGLWLRPDQSLTLFLEGARVSRDVAVLFRGSATKTYAFPRTVVKVAQQAFNDIKELRSVRLNEGLEELGNNCFTDTGIRRLVLPSSVRSIDDDAFVRCANLRYADLRAARSVRELGSVFGASENLRTVLLGDGLEAIGFNCFFFQSLEEIVIPGSVKHIKYGAFYSCQRLRRVVFTGDGLETIEGDAFMHSGIESFAAPASLKRIGSAAFFDCKNLKHADFGACTLRSGGDDFFSARVFKNSGLESIVLPRALRVIKERTFLNCENLKSVIFGESPMLEEIGVKAFFNCALESFSAPPQLKKIGVLAFGMCNALRSFRMNAAIQEMDFLCFWRTVITSLNIPSRVRKTPKQLGLDQKDSDVLRLPDGLEVVGEKWFSESDVEKLVVSSSVKVLRKCAFS